MFYIVDFIKELFNKKNLGLLIYLVLNFIVIFYVFSNGFLNLNGIVTAAVVYFVTLIVALSPIGEAILRFQNGFIKIRKLEDSNRIATLFDEVYSEAKKIDSSLSKNIKLFYTNDEFENALAIGRNTICITRGLLNCSDEEIKAVLAHEFGHLANKDTDALLLVVVGNLFVTLMFMIARLIAWVFGSIVASASKGVANIIYVIFDLMIIFAMWIWTKIGVLLVNHSSRNKEFLADAFAQQCGYQEGLITFFMRDDLTKVKGIFSSLMATHPDSADRIEKLQNQAILESRFA